LIACAECDLLHQALPLVDGGSAHCSRCGAKLYQDSPGALDTTLALYLAALIAFAFANSYPFLSLKIGARMETVYLANSAWSLAQHHEPLLGILVLLTSIISPLLMIIGHLYLLLPRKFGCQAVGYRTVFRLLNHIAPWSMVSIFMLGTLVAVVKLLDLAEVVPGIGAAALVLMMLFTAGAESRFTPKLIWPTTSPLATASCTHPHASAAKNGLMRCHCCTLLVPIPPASASRDAATCPRCGSAIHLRKPASIQRTWSLLIAAGLLLIPANIYPVMTVIQIGQGEPSTILSGVRHLAASGMWGLSLIVFFASIVIPILKLVVFSSILLTIHWHKAQRPIDRTRLCRLSTLLGAWSMIDIFVIALLTALVQMGAIAMITPNIGALFFSSVVIITILAAESFDSRLIWDTLPTP